MLLTTWITDTRTSERVLATRLGCSVSAVNRIRRGITMPEASVIARIVAITDGQVTANDLFAAHQAAHDPAITVTAA